MTITYTTKINSLYTLPKPSGYVASVEFSVFGTDGKNTAKINGNCQFTPEENKASVLFSDLTEDDVINWINEATDNQAFYYANIKGQIDSIVNPPVNPVNTPLPW